MIFELKDTSKASFLFAEWQETMIFSCLQGIMGKIYADSLQTPTSAMAVLGDFCFLAGEPNEELLSLLAGNREQLSVFPRKEETLFGSEKKRDFQEGEESEREFRILVPQNQGWADLTEAYFREKANKVTRYAMKKEPDVFCRKHLQAAVNGLPEGYVLCVMDEALFWACRRIAWCKDLAAQYEDYAAYQRYGLGAVVLKEGEIVCGASSYSGYLGGIEIEIDTRIDHRRRGLAFAAGARLILECLDRGWYPSWDAQNRWSVALAQKLGYHFDYEYTAYEIMGICGR